MIYLDPIFHYGGSGGMGEGNWVEEGVLTGLGGARGQEETGNWEGRQLEMFESTSLCNRSECFHSNT